MFSDGFCCKLTNQMLASWHIRMSRALQRRVWRLFTHQMKQGIDKKIIKRWRSSTFRQLSLLFVLMAEIDPSLFFWLAKKKCSSVLSDTYGSVSAGREKWPFNVLFFLKSGASVWLNLMRYSLVFSILSFFSYVLDAENTLVGPVGPF